MFSSWPALKNHVDGVSFEALIAAAEAGDVAAVRRLAKARPDLINPNHAEFRDSALHRAVLRRNEELTRVLMQLGANARVGIWPHRDATSAYAIAVDREYSEMENARVDPARFYETARLLLQGGAELTPRAAVALGDREAVLRRHRDGRLPNEIHMFRGGLLAIAVRVNRLDMVATLLDLGLDPDESVVTDDGGRSFGMPLGFASMCGRHEIAELLLARGADVNAIVYAGADALGRAQDEKMKALLLKHGVRLTVEQLPGGEQGRETAKAILAGTLPASSLNVVNPTPTDLAEQMLWAASWSDPEIVRLCLPHMTRPRNDPWWNYVLIHAALPDSFKLILDHGVDPDVRGVEGYTVLHNLASGHCKWSENHLIRATMLLDAGALLTIRDSLLKSTPLGWACRWGRIELVKLYLERGADALEADAERWATPLVWATKRGHHEIVQLLRSAGAGA